MKIKPKRPEGIRELSIIKMIPIVRNLDNEDKTDNLNFKVSNSYHKMSNEDIRMILS